MTTAELTWEKGTHPSDWAIKAKCLKCGGLVLFLFYPRLNPPPLFDVDCQCQDCGEVYEHPVLDVKP